MLRDKIEKNWNYMQSWKDKSNAYHGIVSTYWDSDNHITLPHVMNHFPMIEGYIHLIDKFSEESFKSYAIEDGEFLLESFNKNTGIFSNAWGDLPGKDTGVVHQSAAAGAFVELAKLSSEEKYLEYAIKSFKSSKERWPGILMNGVANQALKYIHGVMRLNEISKSDYKQFEGDIHRYIKELKVLIHKVNDNAILIDQSIFSELLMTVYEAKCIHGLLALYKNDIEKQWAQDTIIKLVNGITHRLYIGNGQYLSHIDFDETPLIKIVKILSAVSRRVLSPASQLNIESVRKRFKKQFSKETISIGPVWLSRIADFSYILNKVNAEFDLDLNYLLDEINLNIDTHQLENGGVPNSSGPWKGGPDEWQRFVCSTRWNAYVFRNYCLRVAEKPTFKQSTLTKVCWGDNKNQLTEDNSSVIYTNNEAELIWQKPVI